MGTDTKKAAGVGGGYGGRTGSPKAAVRYITGGMVGQDGTGFEPVQKANQVAQNIRAELSDTLQRRKAGFRGL